MKERFEWVGGACQGVAHRRCGRFPSPLMRMVFGLTLATACWASAQGLPPETRANIHTLFNGHDLVRRELTLTDDGYEATTTSEDSHIAAALQEHVQQMQERLGSGRAIRRWDPAFAEFRAYYEEIDFKVETTQNGVKVVARGRTPEGVRVAQNHAGIINEFVADGWKAHDVGHPAVLASEKPMEVAGGSHGGGRGKGRCGGGGCQGGCGRGGAATAGDQSTTEKKVEP